MSVVYLVVGIVTQECSEPIKAFKSEEDADAFCYACEQANKSLPTWPHNTIEHPDWGAFCALKAAAEKSHPAGEWGAANADFYRVVEVDLVD
jgi:hypothetical protein